MIRPHFFRLKWNPFKGKVHIDYWQGPLDSWPKVLCGYDPGPTRSIERVKDPLYTDLCGKCRTAWEKKLDNLLKDRVSFNILRSRIAERKEFKP